MISDIVHFAIIYNLTVSCSLVRVDFIDFFIFIVMNTKGNAFLKINIPNKSRNTEAICTTERLK